MSAASSGLTLAAREILICNRWVDSDSTVGGVVGQNLGAVTDTCWGVEATGQLDGIGDGQGDATGPDTDKMQGEATAQKMEGLDFERRGESWLTPTAVPH